MLTAAHELCHRYLENFEDWKFRDTKEITEKCWKCWLWLIDGLNPFHIYFIVAKNRFHCFPFCCSVICIDYVNHDQKSETVNGKRQLYILLPVPISTGSVCSCLPGKWDLTSTNLLHTITLRLFQVFSSDRHTHASALFQLCFLPTWFMDGGPVMAQSISFVCTTWSLVFRGNGRHIPVAWPPPPPGISSDTKLELVGPIQSFLG